MWRNTWRGKPWGDLGNRHRGCGRDMLGQTVPSTDSSNREGPITDGGQPCKTDIQRQWGSRSKAICTDRERETKSHKPRHTHRHRHRKTETERQRQRERDTLESLPSTSCLSSPSLSLMLIRYLFSTMLWDPRTSPASVPLLACCCNYTKHLMIILRFDSDWQCVVTQTYDRLVLSLHSESCCQLKTVFT